MNMNGYKNHVNDLNQLNLAPNSKFSLSKFCVRFTFVVVVTMLVSSVDVFAAKDLIDVIDGFCGFLYNVCFALCVVGFSLGIIGLIFSKNPDDKKQSCLLLLGVIFLMVFPYFLKIGIEFFFG